MLAKHDITRLLISLILLSILGTCMAPPRAADDVDAETGTMTDADIIEIFALHALRLVAARRR